MSWVFATRARYGEAAISNETRRLTHVGGTDEIVYEVLLENDEVTDDDGPGLAGPDSALTGARVDGDEPEPEDGGTDSQGPRRPGYVAIPRGEWIKVCEIDAVSDDGLAWAGGEELFRTRSGIQASRIAKALTSAQ